MPTPNIRSWPARRPTPSTHIGSWPSGAASTNCCDERRQHLERIIELDPNHAEARAALGFRQKNGQWMNRDDVMASRGLVLFEGKYVTPQQVELLKQQKETTRHASRLEEQDRATAPLAHRPAPDQAAQAHAEILAIHDPQAAEAIVAALRRENDPELKRLWIEVASQLDHRAAIDALVDLSLTDPDEEIRHQCLEYLIKSRRPGLVTPYIRALKDKDNEIINRAGAALGQIGDRDAIGPLIDALITKHKIKVSDANPDQHAYTFSQDSGAFSFGGSGPQVVVQSRPQPGRARCAHNTLRQRQLRIRPGPMARLAGGPGEGDRGRCAARSVGQRGRWGEWERGRRSFCWNSPGFGRWIIATSIRRTSS